MGLKKEVDKDERERERVAQGVENTRESASQCHYQFWRGISLTGAHVCLSVCLVCPYVAEGIPSKHAKSKNEN